MEKELELLSNSLLAKMIALKREDVGLTDRAKKVIELAVDEARKLNHHYIGTEHILIGILREGDGVAAGVLENLGASLEDVRIESEKILSENVTSNLSSSTKNKSTHSSN